MLKTQGAEKGSTLKTFISYLCHFSWAQPVFELHSVTSRKCTAMEGNTVLQLLWARGGVHNVLFLAYFCKRLKSYEDHYVFRAELQVVIQQLHPAAVYGSIFLLSAVSPF